MSTLRIVLASALAVCACFALSRALPGPKSTDKAKNLSAPDATLQTAAASALGNREGAIVIMDAQTGRVRSVVNPKLAFEQAFAPGSAIKPFTALAALRGGVIEKNTRMRCREKYKPEERVDTCAHPRNLAPFTPAEAVAYSCNYYFAKVGEQLEEDNISRMLTELGFGQTTGIDDEHESPGVLARG